MSELYEEAPIENTLDGAWRGTIATDAANMDDTVEVLLRSHDGKHRFGPAQWVARGHELPERGNQCLVVFDEKSMPYVIAWWPFDPGAAAGRCHVRRNTNQEINSGVAAAVIFNVQVTDDSDMWAPAPNPTRVYIPTTRWYDIFANVRFEEQVAGNFRQLSVVKNNASSFAIVNASPTGTVPTVLTLSVPHLFVAGDYVELYANQDSGSPLDIVYDNDYSIEFKVIGR